MGAIQTVGAQVPRNRPELPGRDFRPDGAWRRRTTTIREQRRSLLRQRATAALNARVGSAAPRVAGAFHLPIVLVRPSDAVTLFTPQQYRDILFSSVPAGRPYSLSTFYAQLSSGAISIDGTVFNWWTAPQPAAYYEDRCNGIGVSQPCANPRPNGAPSPMGELLLGALTALDDGSVDWGAFDNDGADGIPNSGDDDGYVDFVTFIHPAVDGACGTSHLWSHRWVLRVWNGGAPYVTKTPRAGGGSILIDDYILQTGVGGSTACQASRIMPIGTMAHETGHAFGLPDLYDTDPSALQSEGIGEWGLMGSGNYVSPDSPARYEAWSLLEMGWVTVAPISDSRTIVTNPVTQSDSVFYLPVDGRDEYFLLENRQPLESDSALLNPNRPGGKLPGLLIWHIDNAKVQSASARAANTVNVGPIPGVALVQADGANQLRLPITNGASNRGDAGDPYPGSTANTRFTWQSRPRAEDNAGGFAGFVVDQIRQVTPKGAMSFRIVRRGLSVIAPDRDGVMISVDGKLMPRFEEVIPPGERVSLSAQDAAAIGDGRTGLVFKDWSNGQPREFELTADPVKPDTLIARYATAYRVRQVGIRGSGDLTTPISQISSGGGYVAENTSVTLRAVPSAGAQFLGWRGDTTTSNLELTLTPQHAYDLILDFSIAPSVTLQDAARVLLGGAVDRGPYLGAGLDRDGNHNGTYDLADFLRFAASRRGAGAPVVAASAAAPATPAANAGAAATPPQAAKNVLQRRPATSGVRQPNRPTTGGNR